MRIELSLRGAGAIRQNIDSLTVICDGRLISSLFVKILTNKNAET